MVLPLLLCFAGILLGFGISWDLSNHPSFPIASCAFIFFWTVVGGFIGWWVGEKTSDWLEWY